jgi:hypothetical protein
MQVQGMPRPHTSARLVPQLVDEDVFQIPNYQEMTIDEQGTVNLQLDELQKVFDLFHTELQTIEVEPRLVRMGHPSTIKKRVRKMHNFAEV